jgi:putative endonuclease
MIRFNHPIVFQPKTHRIAFARKRASDGTAIRRLRQERRMPSEALAQEGWLIPRSFNPTVSANMTNSENCKDHTMDFPNDLIPDQSGSHISETMLCVAEEEPSVQWWYVYRIESQSFPKFGYTGSTHHLKRRLQQHNRGENHSTAPYIPFRLTFAAAFPTKKGAMDFEAYLKTGSGKAFAQRRLWDQT